MAIRIGRQVVRGKLDNSQPDVVDGWVELIDHTLIQLELTGNLNGQFKGVCFAFQVGQPSAPRAEDILDEISGVQTGCIGDVLFRERRVPRCSIQEFVQRKARGESPPVDIKPCLYLEWYGPQGRVVAEIEAPTVDAGDHEIQAELLPREMEGGGVEIVSFVDGVKRYAHLPLEGGDQDDPYGLFPQNLEARLRSFTQPGEPSVGIGQDTVSARKGWREWDEVIPGLDPEIKKQYDLWDEVIHDDENHVPVMTLFDPPLKLPPMDAVSAEQATPLVDEILTELEKLSIVLEVCEHFSDLDCYRLLVEEILPHEKISPRQPESGFVTHLATWYSCPKCQEEFGFGD